MISYEEIRRDIISATDANDSETLLQIAAELDAHATPLSDATACNARGLSDVLRHDQSSAHAQFDRALMLFEQLGHKMGAADVLLNIGNTYKSTGDHVVGRENYLRALDLYTELGDRGGIASASGNVGVMSMNIGDFPTALEYFHRSLALYQLLENRNGVAGITCNIGIVYSFTGDYPAALEQYDRALAMCEDVGNQQFAANITGNMGSVYMDIEDHATALTYFHRALALYEEIGDRRGMASTLNNIGIVHSNNNDYASAVEYFHRALARCEELNLRHVAANVSSNIFAAYVSMGSDDEAWASLRSLDDMHINEPGVQVSNELNRAILQLRKDNTDDAVASTQRALVKAQEHGMRSLEARAHKALRELAQIRNDFAAYIEHNNEYTRITEEINGKNTATKLAMQAKQREIDSQRKETEKFLAVLHSTLPKEVADRVARGEVVNDHFENATVIFLDIVGFTEISSTMPSQDVIALLDDVFTQCDEICAKHGVTKIKTIGDSYMCVAFENVLDAASCAIDMSRIQYRMENRESMGRKLEYRIGMHCGPVTAGVIGKERMQYDVWGDTVNVASRMESTSEPGRIHVSEALATAINGSTTVAVKLRGGTEVKGKGTMQTYWLE